MKPGQLPQDDVAGTEAKLADAEAHTQTVLDALLDGVISIDERGIIETVNPAAIRIFGYEFTHAFHLEVHTH